VMQRMKAMEQDTAVWRRFPEASYNLLVVPTLVCYLSLC
jgi:hypothetical protein